MKGVARHSGRRSGGSAAAGLAGVGAGPDRCRFCVPISFWSVWLHQLPGWSQAANMVRGRGPHSGRRATPLAHQCQPAQLPVCDQAAAASNAAARLTAAAAPAAACRPSGVRAMLGGRLRTWGRAAATSTIGEQTSRGLLLEAWQDRAAGSAAAVWSCCLPVLSSVDCFALAPMLHSRHWTEKDALPWCRERLTGAPVRPSIQPAAAGAARCCFLGFPGSTCLHLLVAVHS